MTELEEEEEISKILGQFRLSLNGLLAPLRLYGQALYVDRAIPQILNLAWQMHWKLAGLDIPYETEEVHW